MAASTVPPHGAEQVASLLDSAEIIGLVRDLEATRWTGRPGYPIRSMVGMCLVKSLYGLPTWSRTARLVSEHAALQVALGDTPSVYACYRFTAKLRQHSTLLDRCLAGVLGSLKEAMPEFGRTIAIDGSDLPAYANGHRNLYKDGPLRTRFSDPDATWGHRSAVSTRGRGGYYGYKVHAAVCAATDLPVAWRVETAATHEAVIAPGLLDAARRFGPTVCVMDKGYDSAALHAACEDRGIRPVVPLRETPAVKKGKAGPPTCDHGSWTFAGADDRRKASKWRCPTGECRPASVWVKASRLHPLIPRESARFEALYRQRGAVEREFGRLKHEWALLPLRVRRFERVRLHADLSILARLVVALDRARVAATGAAAAA